VTNQLLSLPYHDAKERVLESFEKTYLLEHLKAAHGVVTRAAQRAWRGATSPRWRPCRPPPLLPR
jgi:hypothetical protein